MLATLEPGVPQLAHHRVLAAAAERFGWLAADV